MRSSLKFACAFTLGIAAVATMAGACGGTGDSGSGRGDGGSGGTGSGTSQGGGTASGPTMSSSTGEDISVGSVGAGSDAGGDAACAASEAEATLKKKPVDIIFIIDNSGSMTGEILAVQSNINDNFANIIGMSGIDYRVIMLARHGDAAGAQSICVKGPLSTTTCEPLPQEPGQNPPIFYHYSMEIDSHNTFCRLYNSYGPNPSVADDFGYGPNGWSEWLRTDAFKVFVNITDDSAGSCTVNGVVLDDNNNVNDGITTANNFDVELLALDPAQFGDATKRNYVWHSIVGLKAKDPVTEAYGPGEPMMEELCTPGAVAEGSGYQALSILTGGLRFPVCENASFDVVFQEIAKGVVEGTQVVCEFAVPDPPPGETIDPATVVVEYTPSGGGAPTKFKQVASAATCAADSFYIEDETIKLCPESCALVQADPGAKVIVLFGCDPMIQ
jgi:hypothetical protein